MRPGQNEIALDRGSALSAVDLLRADRVPILGGDVYFRYGDKIDLGYANWHTEYKPGEGRSAYLQRTWDLTERYIRDFSDARGGEPLFVFVLGQ
jgi:Immunity protein 40